MTTKYWIKSSLEKISSIIGDGLHGTPQYTNEGIYAFVNGNNLYNGKIIIKTDTKHVDFLEYKKYKKNLNNRTLFVSINGTLGNVAEYNNEKIILGKSVCYINVKEEIDRNFIKYILISPKFQRYMQCQATGTTIKNISLKQIRDYEFLLPPLETQRKIAKVLSDIDDKIELNNKINENLEQQAMALFNNYFPYKIDDLLPDNWRIGTFGEIIELHDNKRIPLSGQDRDLMQNKIYPYYGASSLMDYVDNYIFDGIYLLLGEDGTVVNNYGSPILQYVWGKFWVNNHAHILTGKNGFNVESLYLLFKHTPIKSIVTGAVQAKISQANLKNLSVVIPPKNLLDEFNNKVTKLFELIRNNKDENEKLIQFRDMLLPKLMSGEIDVSELNIP